VDGGGGGGGGGGRGGGGGGGGGVWGGVGGGGGGARVDVGEGGQGHGCEGSGWGELAATKVRGTLTHPLGALIYHTCAVSDHVSPLRASGARRGLGAGGDGGAVAAFVPVSPKNAGETAT